MPSQSVNGLGDRAGERVDQVADVVDRGNGVLPAVLLGAVFNTESQKRSFSIPSFSTS
jgi:hypothetical protein